MQGRIQGGGGGGGGGGGWNSPEGVRYSEGFKISSFPIANLHYNNDILQGFQSSLY